MSAPTPVPILDLAPEIESLWPELSAAFERVMRSGRFILGPEVAAFEAEASAYLGARHAIGVNSGTDALVIALRALDIGPGDEVITTSFSFFATAESIAMVGATPVFVDIDAATFNIDPAALEAALTRKTRAIMPVHLYGRPCDMTAIMGFAEAHDLDVIEDCAQSFGARSGGQQTGTFGRVGAYSFFPSKNLGGFGDGGLITTDDDGVADQARMLRAHGSKRKYRNEMLGYNSRLDELQAALLRVRLPHVDRWNAARVALAAQYDSALANVPGLATPASCDGHVYHQYTVSIANGARDDVARHLANAGIQTMVYYPVPQHRLPVFADQHPEALPATERAAEQVLSLPISPSLDASTVAAVARELAAALDSNEPQA